MLGILIPLLIFTSIAYVLQFFWTNRKLFAAAAHIPGPPGFLPLIGGIFQFYGKSDAELASALLEISKQYSSPVKFWLGPMLVVMVDRPEDLKIVLNSDHCLDKVNVYRFFHVDQGLFAAPASLWKVQRKALMPAFGPKVVDGYLPAFSKKCRQLSDELEQFLPLGEVDVQFVVEKYTLSSICATIFEYDVDISDEVWTRTYIESIDKLISLINQRIYNPLIHPDQLYKLTASFREETSQFKIFRHLPRVIRDEVLARKKHDTSTTPSTNFIDRMFRLAVSTNDTTSVQHQIETIIFAGSETSATTITTALLMMAIHPDIQSRVYQEIESVCPNPAECEFLDQMTLSRLTYMDRVLKETMRLFPIGPLVGRKATAEIKLGSHVIPAGANVAVPIFKLHRDPAYWGPDAELFDPDNFLPEKVARRHPYSHMPFLAGVRNCVGIRYSWQLMKVMLVHLLWKYRFSTTLKVEDLQLKLCMVLKIINGNVLTIERRAQSV